MTGDRVLYRCHVCGMTMQPEEPRDRDDYGWKHALDCGWGAR